MSQRHLGCILNRRYVGGKDEWHASVRGRDAKNVTGIYLRCDRPIRAVPRCRNSAGKQPNRALRIYREPRGAGTCRANIGKKAGAGTRDLHLAGAGALRPRLSHGAIGVDRTALSATVVAHGKGGGSPGRGGRADPYFLP